MHRHRHRHRRRGPDQRRRRADHHRCKRDLRRERPHRRHEPQRQPAEALRSGRAAVFDVVMEGQRAAGAEPICGGSMRILIVPSAAAGGDAYARAAEAAPIYADLENLFRLSALLRALALKHANALATADLAFYLRECPYLRETPMPDSLKGLVNAKEARTTVGLNQYTFMPITCGGVSMDMAVAPRQFRADTAGELSDLRAAVLRDRPARSAVSWTLRAP